MSCNKFNDKGYYIQYLDDDSFKNFDKLIKDEFNEICCGYCNCDIQDVSDIAKVFLKRVTSHSVDDNRRGIGFVGELIYYVFAKHKFPFLRALNPLLNTEENNFKKGFDMLSEADNEIWYSEVKSGEYKMISSKSINALNIEKLDLAYADLNEKLDGNNRNTNYWITAKLKVRLCLEEKEEINKIAKLLDSDMKSEHIKNKIIVSVIFGKSSEEISETKVTDKLKRIRINDEKVIIVCIRENTLRRTLSIIEELSNNE